LIPSEGGWSFNVSLCNAGVHASADGAEVATPVSLIEWFLNFYEAVQEGDVKPVEGIVRAGEVLFVPRGWWHLAINLEVISALSFPVKKLEVISTLLFPVKIWTAACSAYQGMVTAHNTCLTTKDGIRIVPRRRLHLAIDLHKILYVSWV